MLGLNVVEEGRKKRGDGKGGGEEGR